jgi:histidinol dehydrogenase
MLNVRKTDLPAFSSSARAAKSDGRALADGEWVAVNTVIEEQAAWSLIPKLKQANAQGIVEYPLNKVVCDAVKAMRENEKSDARRKKKASSAARTMTPCAFSKAPSRPSVTALAGRGATDLADVEPAVRRIVMTSAATAIAPCAATPRVGTDWATRTSRCEFQKTSFIRRGSKPIPNCSRRSSMPRAISAAMRSGKRRGGNRDGSNEWRREIEPGVSVGQLVRPLESVGCYVPGGRYPLPSTVLMTVIPAQVAGVQQIRVVSPRPAQATLAAAAFLGVREFYRVGGAQAIAALAYGTEEIPRVDKIVGPGNRYVTAAKKLVAFDCAIEFLAGPTEAVVISADGDPACIASDLVAQAEHDPDALCVFITTSRALAKKVQNEVQNRARVRTRLPPIALPSRRDSADRFARAGGRMSNRIAPEHLTLPAALAPAVQHAGAVFLDEFTPTGCGRLRLRAEPCAAHGAMARVRGGLSVLDFVRVIGCQQVSRAGNSRIGPAGHYPGQLPKA